MGTSSLRRQAQLKVVRPDLVIHPLRGNVDTRMRKLEEGEYDAIILAAAGLTRLGKTQLVKEVLSEEFMCPAAGQGALGIEIRAGDDETRKHLAFLDDADGARDHHLRTRAAEQAGRRMPGPDRRICRSEGRRSCADRDCGRSRMARLILREQQTRKRSGSAGRAGGRNSVAARRRPRFWTTFTADEADAATAVKTVVGCQLSAVA